MPVPGKLFQVFQVYVDGQLIAADGRPGLHSIWHLVPDLVCGFQYEWAQQVERQVFTGQDVVADLEKMIDKIIGEDGGDVQHGALLVVDDENGPAELLPQAEQSALVFRTGRIDTDRVRVSE